MKLFNSDFSFSTKRMLQINRSVWWEHVCLVRRDILCAHKYVWRDITLKTMKGHINSNVIHIVGNEVTNFFVSKIPFQAPIWLCPLLPDVRICLLSPKNVKCSMFTVYSTLCLAKSKSADTTFPQPCTILDMLGNESVFLTEEIVSFTLFICSCMYRLFMCTWSSEVNLAVLCRISFTLF